MAVDGPVVDFQAAINAAVGRDVSPLTVTAVVLNPSDRQLYLDSLGTAAYCRCCSPDPFAWAWDGHRFPVIFKDSTPRGAVILEHG